ncbi:hypothetical protein GCM10009602_31120 [Nocardiopsis tropica]
MRKPGDAARSRERDVDQWRGSRFRVTVTDNRLPCQAWRKKLRKEATRCGACGRESIRGKEQGKHGMCATDAASVVKIRLWGRSDRQPVGKRQVPVICWSPPRLKARPRGPEPALAPPAMSTAS